MKVDIFVSYHSASLRIVEAIVNKLEGMGMRCWYSNRDNHENTYASAIMDALEHCKVFLLVLNQSSSNSHHVLNELEIVTDRLAKKEPVFVVPFRVADEEISREARFYIKRFHWIDAMTPPMQERIDELAEYVEMILKRLNGEEREQSGSRGQRARKPASAEYERPSASRQTKHAFDSREWEFDSEEWGFDPMEFLGVEESEPFEFENTDDDEPFAEPWEWETPKRTKKRGTSNVLMKDCFAHEQLSKLPVSDRRSFPMCNNSLKKLDITAICFTNTLKDAPAYAVDVSAQRDESVLMWKTPGKDDDFEVELVVGAEGVIDGSLACEDLFNGMDRVEVIDFGDCFSTKGATSMLRMFQDCSRLKSVDLRSFDTSEVTNMAFMFHGCRALKELDVSGFDTSKVEVMNCTFERCSSLKQLDIRNFDFSSIIQADMFGFRTNIDVLYDVHAVRQMNEMNQTWFCESLQLEQLPRLCLLRRDCFSDENFKKLDIFAGRDRCYRQVVSVRFTDSIADAPADGVDVSHAGDGSVLMWGVPAGADGDVEIIVGADGIVDGSIACADMFLGLCWLEKVHFGKAFNSHGATSMARMFDSCSELREVDLEALDTSNVHTMSYMLYGCEKLEVIDVSCFNTSKVQWMNHMFDGCNAAKRLDLRGFDFSNVEQLENLFGEDAAYTVEFHPDSLKVLSKRNRERFYESLGMPKEYWD